MYEWFFGSGMNYVVLGLIGTVGVVRLGCVFWKTFGPQTKHRKE